MNPNRELDDALAEITTALKNVTVKVKSQKVLREATLIFTSLLSCISLSSILLLFHFSRIILLSHSLA